MAFVNNASARGTVKRPHERDRASICTGLCRVERRRLPLDSLVSSVKASHGATLSDEQHR